MSFKVVRSGGNVVAFGPNDDSYEPESGYSVEDQEPVLYVDPKLAIKAQIQALEAEQLLPRITREFMLASFEQAAAAAGIDPMINVGYAKLKEFDTQIAVLRDLLNQN